MTKSPKLRKYQIIWQTIKKEGSCTIEVQPCFQAFVKKAVMKEKYKDDGFKLLNHHDHFYLKVSSPAPDRLTFTLKQSIGLAGIIQNE
jgi:hypothetical protein